MNADHSTSQPSGSIRRQYSGTDEVLAAIERSASIQLIVVVQGERSAVAEEILERAQTLKIPVRSASVREMKRISSLSPSPEIVCMERLTPQNESAGMFALSGLIWGLVGTAYPGNAGLVIRSAEVSGAAGICIDAPFDRTARRECLRASMRADRYFPVEFMGSGEMISGARSNGRQIIAVEQGGDRLPWEVDLNPASLIIVGGEAEGIPEAVLSEADSVVSIPSRGFIRSYNLQAAMAVLMGEALRQSASASHEASSDD